MIILSIDTALRTCGIGVMRAGDPVFSKTELMPRGQDQALAVAVQDGLKDAGVIVSDISAIAVTTGPGSFTGIRIGMAFARGMASVLKVPLIGMTTSDVLARQTSEQGNIAVVIKIKHDAYVAQIFNQGVAQTQLTAVDQITLKELLQNHLIKTVITHSEQLNELLEMPCHTCIPDPAVMLKVASEQYDKCNDNISVVRPVYIRQADVTVKA